MCIVYTRTRAHTQPLTLVCTHHTHCLYNIEHHRKEKYNSIETHTVCIHIYHCMEQQQQWSYTIVYVHIEKNTQKRDQRNENRVIRTPSIIKLTESAVWCIAYSRRHTSTLPTAGCDRTRTLFCMSMSLFRSRFLSESTLDAHSAYFPHRTSSRWSSFPLHFMLFRALGCSLVSELALISIAHMCNAREIAQIAHSAAP